MTNFFALVNQSRDLVVRNAALTFSNTITAAPTANRANTIPDADGAFVLDSTLAELVARSEILYTGLPDDPTPGFGFGVGYRAQIGIINGANAWFTVPAGYEFVITDFVGVASANAAGATGQLFAGANAVSDALDLAVVDAVARAATLDNTYTNVPAGTALSVTGANNPNAVVTVEGYFLLA